MTRGEVVVEEEIDFPRKDGERRTMAVSASPIRGPGGAVVAAVATFADVTDRRRADDALRASDERFSKAFMASPDALLISRIDDGLIREVNDSYLRLFGFGREEVIGRRTTDLGVYVDPDDRGRGVDEFKKQGRLRDHEFAMRRKTGEPVSTRSSVEPLEIGGETYLLSIIRDVTEEKRTEEALREGEARFRSLADEAPVAIGMSRLGQNLYVNPAYRKCFGIGPDEPIVGRSIFDEIAPEDHQRVRSRVRARYSGERAEASYEFMGIRRDGSRFPVQVEVGQIELPDGSASLAFVVDMTERRRAEWEIRRSEAKLKFLAALDSETRALADPDEITAVTARLLGEYLNVDRCAYAEVEEHHFPVTGNYTRGVPSIVGRFRLAEFGRECLKIHLEGRPYVVDDVEASPLLSESDLAAYRQTDVRAVISVPLHKGGRFAAGLAVHQKTPRQWTADGVELVQLVISRCWESLERTRVTRSLLESEERFRLFMDYSPASAWITDTDGRVEYLSPAYHRMFRLPEGSPVGRAGRVRPLPEGARRAVRG